MTAAIQIATAIFASFFIIQGLVFAAVGWLGGSGVAQLSEPWGRVFFITTGLYWATSGLWGLVRKKRAMAQRSDADIRAGLARTRRAGVLELFLGACVLSFLFGDLTGDLVKVESAAFFVVFGVFAVLRGLLLLSSGSVTPEQARGNEAKLVAESVRRDRLKELDTGIGASGRARILEIRRKGIGYEAGAEEGEYVEVEMEVARDGGAPYRVTWDGAVSYLFAGRLVPGQSVPVRIHPMDQTVLTIDWGKP